MKVWNNGKFVEIKVGQRVLVAKCGSGKSYFGEFGRFEKATNSHMVFITDSGAVVKTKIDDYGATLQTVGKASKNHYFVSLVVDGREDMIHQNVSYWNEKKLCFENK